MFDFFKRKKTVQAVSVLNETINKEQIEKSAGQNKKACTSKLEDIWKLENETDLVIALDNYFADKCNSGRKAEILSSPEGGADIFLDLLMPLNQYYVYKPRDSSHLETF